MLNARAALLACTALVLGCTHDFDAFRPSIDDVGADTRPDPGDSGGVDSSPNDTRDTASDNLDTSPIDTKPEVPPDCGDTSACMDADVACGMDCGTKQATCLTGCGSAACKAACSSKATDCRTKCWNSCTMCALAVGCDNSADCKAKAGL